MGSDRNLDTEIAPELSAPVGDIVLDSQVDAVTAIVKSVSDATIIPVVPVELVNEQTMADLRAMRNDFSRVIRETRVLISRARDMMNVYRRFPRIIELIDLLIEPNNGYIAAVEALIVRIQRPGLSQNDAKIIANESISLMRNYLVVINELDSKTNLCIESYKAVSLLKKIKRYG